MSENIEKALESMRQRGFVGERGKIVFEVSDLSGFHTIRVVEYTFPDCTELYVETEEDPSHFETPARVHSFGAAVHVLQNIGDDEVWKIGSREGAARDTPEGVFGRRTVIFLMLAGAFIGASFGYIIGVEKGLNEALPALQSCVKQLEELVK